MTHHERETTVEDGVEVGLESWSVRGLVVVIVILLKEANSQILYCSHKCVLSGMEPDANKENCTRLPKGGCCANY